MAKKEDIRKEDMAKVINLCESCIQTIRAFSENKLDSLQAEAAQLQSLETPEVQSEELTVDKFDREIKSFLNNINAKPGYSLAVTFREPLDSFIRNVNSIVNEDHDEAKLSKSKKFTEEFNKDEENPGVLMRILSQMKASDSSAPGARLFPRGRTGKGKPADIERPETDGKPKSR